MKTRTITLLALLIAATGLTAQTLITTPEELHNVRDDLSGDYILGNDIDLDPAVIGSETWYDAVLGWEPIGTSPSPFNGTLDGDGYTIYNLTFDRPGEEYLGLFGVGGSVANLTNVHIEDAVATGEDIIGILAGALYGSASNCSSSGTVTGNNHAIGGLIGASEGTIDHCSTSGIVSGFQIVGGLVGWTNSGCISCSSDATVEADHAAGGLIGHLEGGSHNPSIIACFATGDVTGNINYAGGLVGEAYSKILMTDCYSKGNVAGATTVRGGLIGHAYYMYDNNTIIENCYTTCSVGTVGVSIQPFIGSLWYSNPTVVNSYYNSDITGAATNGIGTGRTIEEMTQPYATNTYENWDFTTPVWMADAHYFINEGYPFLSESGLQTVITTAEELHNIRYNYDGSNKIKGHYILANDIDLDPAGLGGWYNPVLGWEPIGTLPRTFDGTFDGNGYTINNLTMNRPSQNQLGLFGYCGLESVLTHIEVRNASISGGSSHDNMGILAGESHGFVDHCSTTGAISGGRWFIGGLIGQFLAEFTDVIMTHCYSDATVSGESTVGGLIGRMGCYNFTYRPILTNSYATGDVSVSGGSCGGLVGDFYRTGTIQNCYASGNVSGPAGLGGLVGALAYPDNHVIENSYCTGNVGTVGVNVQPFIGSTSFGGTPTIINCYYNSDINGTASNGLGIGRTTEEMTYPHDVNTYETWDFSTPIWVEDWASQNSGYPWLLWQNLSPEDVPEPVVTIENPYYTDCGQYAFDITVQDFTLVGALSLTLEYDPGVLTYVDVTIPDAVINAESEIEVPSAGTFKLAGFYEDPVSLGENDILLSLTFDVVTWGVSTDLTWPDDPSELNEVAGPNGELIYATSFNNMTFDIPDELALGETHVGVTCFEGTDGSIDLTVTGGEPDYTYAWTGPEAYTATTQDISGLAAGLYSVTVTDASGCIESITDIELIVLDNIPPIITTCPPNYGLEGCSTADITGLVYSEALVEVPAGDYTTAGGVATDNCAITYYAYQDVSSGTCIITVIRTWTLKDGMGNTITCDQTISIEDSTPPLISVCATDVEVYMNDGCGATEVDLGLPVFTDNCDPAPVATNNASEPYPVGETTVTWTITDVCSNESTCEQTVTVLYNTLGGTLTYHDGGQTLSGVILTLDDGVSPVTATTDIDGIYIFNDLCAGTYEFSADFDGKAVGGINATDAALANYWGVAPWSIESARFYAGDAAPNNYVDATDAGRILTWFVQAGTPTMTNPWSFWVSGEMISANPSSPPSGIQYPEIIIGGTEPTGNLTQDLLGMVTGDFNKSYTSATKASGGSIILLAGDILYVEPGTSFDLPIAAGMNMEVGALSLIFNLPQDVFEVEQVYLGDDPTATLLYKQTQDQLRTGWTTLEAFNLSEGETLLTLQILLLEPIDEGFELSLAADPLNELADGSFITIEDALLAADHLTSSTVGLGNRVTGELSLSNQPNPFHQATTFMYSIPIHGKVILDIYDLGGNRIITLVNESREAGNHKVELLEGSLATGVYMAHLKLDTSEGIKRCTIKIINR